MKQLITIAYPPTYPPAKKAFIASIEWSQIMEVDRLVKWFDSGIQPETIVDSIEEIVSTRLDQRNEKTIMFGEATTKNLHASDYLYSIAPHVPKGLISNYNLLEIKNLAANFSDNLASFLIFESRLNSYDARSDYCFAVSSKNGEREILKNLIKSGNLPEKFLKQSEWKQIGNFAKSWADPKSVLFDNIIGLWFEFDTAITTTEAPAVFSSNQHQTILYLEMQLHNILGLQKQHFLY